MPCVWITAPVIGYLAIRHDDKVLKVNEEKSLLINIKEILYVIRLCKIYNTK